MADREQPSKLSPKAFRCTAWQTPDGQHVGSTLTLEWDNDEETEVLLSLEGAEMMAAALRESARQARMLFGRPVRHG